MSEMQIEILRQVMFGNKMSYSDIHEITENHDLFNYHLRELVKSEYLSKDSGIYSLAKKGKQFVSHMEEDGTSQKQFKVSMFIDLIRREKGKYQMLLHRRLKHPHYGYIGAVTGKLKWGQCIKDNVSRELEEELDISVNEMKVIGVVREIFKNKEMELVGDGVFFVIVVEKWEGDIPEKGEEGEYFWCDIDKILELDRIFKKGFEVGLPHLERYLKNRKEYAPYVIENGTEGLEY